MEDEPESAEGGYVGRDEYQAPHDVPHDAPPAVDASPLFSEVPADPVPPTFDEPTIASQVFTQDDPAADREWADDAEGQAAPDEADEADDGDEDRRKGVSFGTKVLVVASAWVLLTLFLIGQFSGDDRTPEDALTLNQATGTTVAGELGEPVEGEAEEPVDTDGDGEIEEGEPGFATSATVAGAASTSSGGGSTGGSSGTGGGSGGEGGVTGSTIAPVAGGSGSTTTTTARGTSTSGSPSKPTTTTTTSTTNASTTSTTVPPPKRVSVGSTCDFNPASVKVVSGQKVRFENTTKQDRTLVIDEESIPLDKESSYERAFASTTVVKCEGGSTGSITVTVE